LLVEADDVSSGIAEPRGDLGRVHADRLHDLTPWATTPSTVAATLSTMM
jgi:hypothetical protein